MAPLLITGILVFAAGIVGFFFGCQYARWLKSPEVPAMSDAAARQLDTSPNASTPTPSCPSTSVLSFGSTKTGAAATDPVSETAAATAGTPATAVTAAAALAEKAAKPPAQSTAPAPTAVEPPPRSAAVQASAPATQSKSESTAAGSANPNATPLRGPLAVARATTTVKTTSRNKTAKAKTQPKIKTKTTANPAAAAKKTASSSIAAKPAAKAKTAPAARSGETRAKKPRFLPQPRKAGADDLKRIKGVGPALEATLNTLGIFHYNQISKWTPDNVVWVDDHLKFKGRIARDDWINQAEKLATGKPTEFAARVDKGSVASSRGKTRTAKK